MMNMIFYFFNNNLNNELSFLTLTIKRFFRFFLIQNNFTKIKIILLTENLIKNLKNEFFFFENKMIKN